MSHTEASIFIDFPKLKRSFRYAWHGFLHLLETEQNARIHVMAAFLVLFLSVYFRINRLEACLLIMAILLVIGFEIMNTAMEKFLDIVHPDSHYQIRYIKDSMAGAVLVSAVIAFVVGVIVFYPYVAAMFA